MFIQTEPTPNPATLKFLPGRAVLDHGTLDMRDKTAAAQSPLAERLFEIGSVQGVDTVVLLGNSGGGSLMAAYQSQAKEPNVTPVAGMRPAAGLNELPPADGYVASAAHPGRPDVLTAWMDGAVVDENDPLATDPDLDIFDQRNGPPFSPEFVDRYRAAQLARNHAITDWAENELKRVRGAGWAGVRPRPRFPLPAGKHR